MEFQKNSDNYSDSCAIEWCMVEFRPKFANFVRRQRSNRGQDRFRRNRYILRALMLFLDEYRKKIRDFAGIFRSIMELAPERARLQKN
ncbi:MAG: hypothetical protein DMG60_01505 [Acidobacteria bacterium]|nr:MAG: hypothetical protein DMG60_01505 [Acidobacteriota bacterium]